MTDENISRTIYCATCDLPVNRIVDDERGQDDCVCPKCGTIERSEEAIKEAGAQFAQERIDEALSGFKGFDSGLVRITVDRSPKQRFRFCLKPGV